MPSFRYPHPALWVIACLIGSLCAAEPPLDIQKDEEGLHLKGQGDFQHSQRVEKSSDLGDWSPVHAYRGEDPWGWNDRDWLLSPRAYYRLIQAVPPVIAEHPTWRTEINLPNDPFLSEPLGGTGSIFDVSEIRWVKFAIILDGVPTVYFQDSNSYEFHYAFAVERLAPFLGLTAEEFNNISLQRDGQQIILGAVLWAPGRNEYGIQFVGQDVYPREMVRFLYDAVDASLNKPDGAKGYYMPTYEQTQLAEGERQYFASHEIEVSSSDRWVASDVSYAKGWALGRLTFVNGTDIEAAYSSGVLLPTDILITDGVPAELPFLAGIISLSPTTPNSHVAILAQSYGIPFVYLKAQHDRDRVMSWVGETVALRSDDWPYNVDVFQAHDVDENYLQEILTLKEPLDLALTPMEESGSIVISDLKDVVPEDIGQVGGKAANFGFLRREIPDNSPEAIAFTFDLWNAYLDQTLPVGEGDRTLREEIQQRLGGVEWPTDIGALTQKLSEIRDLIEDVADFNSDQKEAILTALEPFDPMQKIRFRSSTNVEDSGVFVGAGLYDSYSGCLADDLDDDDEGPCLCDDEENNERGVFRAIRKVYASFYNLNAVIERLRHRVDESQVGMAVLAHYSFPDEFEAANGVASSELNDHLFYTTMVSQVGAQSVTNPEGGSLPEIVKLETFDLDPGSTTLHHEQRSSLLLLGDDTVLDWQDDYLHFEEMFYDLASAYRDHFPGRTRVFVEFEFKKTTDDDLVVKQMREIPDAPVRLSEAAALINTPASLKVFQGEAGTVLANHRLKSLWQIETASRWLDEEGLSTSLVGSAEVEYNSIDGLAEISGSLSELPGAAYDTPEIDGNHYARDRWTLAHENGETTYELRLQIPFSHEYEARPLMHLGYLRVEYWANYSEPVPEIDWTEEPIEVTEEFAMLVLGHPNDPLPSGAILVERTSNSDVDVELNTSFYWPPAPTGITAGYTAPLEKWVETTITGLTTDPIVLHGFYSQTYRPGHHNFSEEFVFEPALEPGISPAILAELEEKNIRMIYWHTPGEPNDKIKVIGLDDEIRDLKN